MSKPTWRNEQHVLDFLCSSNNNNDRFEQGAAATKPAAVTAAARSTTRQSQTIVTLIIKTSKSEANKMKLTMRTGGVMRQVT